MRGERRYRNREEERKAERREERGERREERRIPFELKETLKCSFESVPRDFPLSPIC